MRFIDIYIPEIHVKSKSMLEELGYTTQYDSDEMSHPILKAFIDDNDIQEIRICSSNIGFIRTYSKYYKVTASE